MRHPRDDNRRNVLITGGAGYLGRALAIALGAEYESVALLDRDHAALIEAEMQVRRSGVNVFSAVADVTQFESISDGVRGAALAMGSLDVLVTNAGTMSRTRFDDLDSDELYRAWSTNVLGTFLTIKAAEPYLANGSAPAIVTMSSAAGLVPRGVTGPAYRAAKAGVIAMTKIAAVELSSKSIRVNGVAPSGIDGGMSNAFSSDELVGMADGSITGRLASSDEVVAAVRFLASPAASYITGQVLAVTGSGS